MLERVSSVKCLLVLIAVCTKGEMLFSEVVRITNLKNSTAWSCAEKLCQEGMIELRKALTLKGPRTLLICKENGWKALEEITMLLKEGFKGP